MEKEQIIKALECCTTLGGCEKCPYYNKAFCGVNLRRDALALIKELTIELDAMRGAANSYKMHNERLTEENERLKSENAKYEAENHSEFNKWLKLEEATKRRHSELFEEAKIAIREGTVREMQENLDELLHTIPTVYNSHFRRLVTQVVERMLNEQQ